MLIKWMVLVLVRVKTPVLASIRDKYIKKEQFAFLKRLSAPIQQMTLKSQPIITIA